jgi:uncharacterized protein
MSSALYVGSVMHRRVKPRAHRLRYRMFWMLFDLDEIGVLSRRLRLFSRERFNLFSFHNADHGDGSGRSLREQAETLLSAAGCDLNGGAIRLLCMPRILGYVFNPISVYYCYGRADTLVALIYEVHNTFGQRHSYVIPVDFAERGTLSQRCVKALYVSPFIGMDITYDFRVREPEERISLSIQAEGPTGPVIIASLAGERRNLSDRSLARVFVTHPLLTLKVVAGIHWDALKLFLKGVQLHPRPAVPSPPSMVPAGETRNFKRCGPDSD